LKITKIETIRLRSRATLIWVRIHTDEGLVGLGESWFGCAAIEADIHDRMAPALLGQDSSRIEALNRQMRPYVGFTGTSAEMRANSAVDVALLDIQGKATGQPLYTMLGGATRSAFTTPAQDPTTCPSLPMLGRAISAWIARCRSAARCSTIFVAS
jgi:L-alanine-DL-glutamate epimerase-like enolase superfamily enzyme